MPVDLDARGLHRRNGWQQWPVDLFVNARHALAPQPPLEAGMEPQRDICILGCIFGGAVERHVIEADPVLGRARQFLEGDRSMPEVAGRQLVHAMVPAPAVERVTHQHSVVIRRDPAGPGVREDYHVIFQILPDLEHTRVGKERVEPSDHSRRVQLVDRLLKQADADLMRHRHIASETRLERQADPDEIGAHCIETVGFAVDGDLAARPRLGDPPVEPVERRRGPRVA